MTRVAELSREPGSSSHYVTRREELWGNIPDIMAEKETCFYFVPWSVLDTPVGKTFVIT